MSNGQGKPLVTNGVIAGQTARLDSDLFAGLQGAYG
jgi:hypothetical protein